MFNSFHRKLIVSTSPTLNHRNSTTYQNKTDILEQIQSLDEQWDAIEKHQQGGFLQMERIFEKIDNELSLAKGNANLKIDQQIDNLEKHLTITANLEREVIQQSRKKLKTYVESKAQIIEDILHSEIREEQTFQKQIITIIDKRLSQIRKKLNRNPQTTQRSKFTKKKEKETHGLKEKLIQKLSILEQLLNVNKEQVKKMKRESEKLMREYLRLGDEIQKARLDREDKQEQIYARIEQLCSGDRTKEETISKIE